MTSLIKGTKSSKWLHAVAEKVLLPQRQMVRCPVCGYLQWSLPCVSSANLISPLCVFTAGKGSSWVPGSSSEACRRTGGGLVDRARCLHCHVSLWLIFCFRRRCTWYKFISSTPIMIMISWCVLFHTYCPRTDVSADIWIPMGQQQLVLVISWPTLYFITETSTHHHIYLNILIWIGTWWCFRLLCDILFCADSSAKEHRKSCPSKYVSFQLQWFLYFVWALLVC